MKLAHFDLIIEIEKMLEIKLIEEYGQNYSLLINPEGKSAILLEHGEIDYNAIEIYIDEKKLTTFNNKEEFWEIIKFLEKEEKINDLFYRLEKNLRESSPHLFEEDIDLNKDFKVFSIQKPVLIFVAAIATVAAIIISIF